MSKIKISCVSFLNSQPFVYGLQQYQPLQDLIDLSLDVPSLCADKLISNQVDVGLVPIATLPQLNNYEIISNYCIGANKQVLSVLLLSNYPIQHIQHIQLDQESRTSNNLTKILAKHHWKINPTFSLQGMDNVANMAKVSIGDKALEERNNFKYAYDLAQQWYAFKNKKFVFACWVANKKLSNDFTNTFNTALNHGIKNIRAMLKEKTLYNIQNVDLYDYLTKNINYFFDEEKQKSLKMYLTLLKTI